MFPAGVIYSIKRMAVCFYPSFTARCPETQREWRRAAEVELLSGPGGATDPTHQRGTRGTLQPSGGSAASRAGGGWDHHVPVHSHPCEEQTCWRESSVLTPSSHPNPGGKRGRASSQLHERPEEVGRWWRGLWRTGIIQKLRFRRSCTTSYETWDWELLRWLEGTTFLFWDWGWRPRWSLERDDGTSIRFTNSNWYRLWHWQKAI